MKNQLPLLKKLNFRLSLLVFSIMFTIGLSDANSQPVLEFCPGTVSGFTQQVGGFRDFNCTDIDFLFLDEPVTYQLDTFGNLISGSISSMQADSMFKYITGFAEFSGTNMRCTGQNVITVTAEDTWETFVVQDGMVEVIRRRFTASCDDGASPDVCFQDIVIQDCGYVLEFCPGTVSGFVDENTNSFRNFNCNDTPDILFTSPVTYQLDRNGNLVAGSFSTAQADFVMKYRTGFAEYTGLCETDLMTITATDEIEYAAGGGTDAIITRTFTAEDCFGVSRDVCIQTIIFQDCLRPVPTLSQWGIIILTLGLFILGVLAFKFDLSLDKA